MVRSTSIVKSLILFSLNYWECNFIILPFVKSRTEKTYVGAGLIPSILVLHEDSPSRVVSSSSNLYAFE